MKPNRWKWWLAGLVIGGLFAGGVWWLANRSVGLPAVRNVFGGYGDNQSVNGFGLLSQILRQRGHQISRTRFLTRQIENAELLIWIHTGPNLPDDEALEYLDGWMDRGGRVVVLGSDYDATLDYWRQVYRRSRVADRDLARWVYRQSLRQELNVRADSPAEILRNSPRYTIGSSNRWMTVTGDGTPRSGAWTAADPDEPWSQVPVADLVAGSDESATDVAPVWVRTWLKPTSDYARVVANVVANEEALPVMWVEQTESRYGRPGRDLWVISSPIFLNNFGIVQPENAALREQFLAEMAPLSRVLFLETGPGPVRMSTTPEDRIDRPWGWMTQPPFPLFALHAMLLAVVFCFARFPVFGRAKQVEFRPRNDFGQHLAEVGRLLKSRKLEGFARQKLEQYQQVVGRGPRRSGRGGVARPREVAPPPELGSRESKTN